MARGVRKAYGSTIAVAGVDLDIAAGEIVAVIGANGAGKTTLVSMLAGLVLPDDGRVEVCGIDVATRPPGRRLAVGYAPQETGVYPTRTVEENLSYFAALHGLRRGALAARVAELAEALDLTTLLGRRAGRLSGGERRRLHTAIALVGSDPVLLLDEPTVGADVDSRTRLLELVRQLATEGTAVCYTTHYLPEVEALDARVVVLRRGGVVASGTVRSLAAGARARVEIGFDGAAPDLAASGGLGAEPVSSGDAVVLVCDDPPRAIAEVLQALGPDAARVRTIDVVEPSLEAVLRDLLAPDGNEPVDGAASAVAP